MALLRRLLSFNPCYLSSVVNNKFLSSLYLRTSTFRSYTTVNLLGNCKITSLKGRNDPPSYSGITQWCQVCLSARLQSKSCWQCQGDVPSDTQFCLSCKSLQPPDHTRDHFHVLGIQRSFNIDSKKLTKRFRMLQSQFHPDRYSLKSEKEQQFAHDHSSAVNKAYQCLQHPVERALYFLHQAGQPLEEGQIDLDPTFLAEIMEVNEELMEAEDKETVQSIGQRNMEILNNLLSEADSAFSCNDIEKARSVVAKIKYYNNIYEKVKSYEREHGIVD